MTATATALRTVRVEPITVTANNRTRVATYGIVLRTSGHSPRVLLRVDELHGGSTLGDLVRTYAKAHGAVPLPMTAANHAATCDCDPLSLAPLSGAGTCATYGRVETAPDTAGGDPR